MIQHWREVLREAAVSSCAPGPLIPDAKVQNVMAFDPVTVFVGCPHRCGSGGHIHSGSEIGRVVVAPCARQNGELTFRVYRILRRSGR